MTDKYDHSAYDYSTRHFSTDAAYEYVYSTDAFIKIPGHAGPHLSWSKSMADNIVDLMSRSHERRQALKLAKQDKQRQLRKYLVHAKIFAPLFFAIVIVSHLTVFAPIKWPLLIGSVPVFLIYLIYPVIRLCLTVLSEDLNEYKYREEIDEAERNIMRLYAYVEAINIHGHRHSARNDLDIWSAMPKYLN